MSNKALHRFVITIIFLTALIASACGQQNKTGEGPDNKAAIDFNDISDGTHRGRFTYGAFNYIVDVVAQGGRVTEIIVVQNKDNEPSEKAVAVLERVVEKQSLNVDLVSGATASSKALLQATENAIKAAIKTE
jgi:uncharacterized protein with FMN-binding domain